ncbi:MAG TPA: preprotein translocase subunit YajC [Gaiellaceae bacterium]|nr:preprotein translocase subunit YajC [Gaiellaceae bacterium]
MEPLIFLAAIAVLFWFLLIRPQRRRQAAQRSLMAGISEGDEVVTAGGIFATVRSVADDHMVLEIAPGTEIRVAKEAVANVMRQAEEPPTTAEEHG